MYPLSKSKKATFSKADVQTALETFYGLELNEEQLEFRNAIWNKEKEIVFCNAKAGTGKTLISVATANLLVAYQGYSGIVYIMSPVQEARQGYLPGTIEDKSEPYMQPLKDALIKIGLNPDQAIASETNMDALKNGTAFIEPQTHTFMRGTSLDNKVVIIDESQNFYFDELKKVLTRVCDTSKVIVIGHSGQCDLYNHPERSGFEPYLEAFESSNDSRVQVCNLVQNYRGWVSNFADDVELPNNLYDKKYKHFDYQIVEL